MDITQNFLKSVLSYDEYTGEFRWLDNRNSDKKGRVAGTINSDGYSMIGLCRKQYGAHRLAWLYMTGCWPTEQIDHKDLNPLNNRIDNLRWASHGQNRANSVGWSKCGVKGVHRYRNRWVAQIHFDKKKIHLGVFDTKEEAGAAYAREAALRHGEFARAGKTTERGNHGKKSN